MDESTGSPRFLITRLSAIGDCVLTMPLACALRDHFPDSFIAWLVEPAAAPLIEDHPCVDLTVVAPRRWLKSPAAVWSLQRVLRHLRFDVALDPQSLTKSSLAAWLSGAKRRIGLAPPWGRELSRWFDREQVAPRSSHVVDVTLELLRPLGIERSEVRFDLPEDRAAAAKAEWLRRGAHLGDRFAVINPGAGWDSRLWPADRYAAVAEHLGVAHDLPSVVVWAGERERQWAEQIAARSVSHAVLAPPTTLKELVALLRRARLYVGSDTGPTHVAAAAGTPCVAMHGTTRPEVSGPYGPQHVVLQQYYQQGTARERRRADNEAMRAISTEAVCRACDAILHRQAATRAA